MDRDLLVDFILYPPIFAYWLMAIYQDDLPRAKLIWRLYRWTHWTKDDITPFRRLNSFIHNFYKFGRMVKDGTLDPIGKMIDDYIKERIRLITPVPPAAPPAPVPAIPSPYERNWYDKLNDAIVRYLFPGDYRWWLELRYGRPGQQPD
jgi:hypothetical protein